MKKCTKCNKIKSESLFSRDKRSPDGLCVHCKECSKLRVLEWRNRNPHKQAEWYRENSEKARRTSVKWKGANPVLHRRKVDEWQKANKEKVREIGRRAYHARRARKLATEGKLSVGLKDRLFGLQRGKCACCGLPLGNDYHLDHIMPLALGGTNTDDNIQLLRAACNMQKRAKHPVDFMRQRGFLL